MGKHTQVTLSEEQRTELEQLIRRGNAPARTNHRAFDAQASERLRALLHQGPRNFGRVSSIWTLELAAEVSFAQGLTAARVSREAVRTALQRLGVSWRRAKQWINSPDPAYERKKTTAAE